MLCQDMRFRPKLSVAKRPHTTRIDSKSRRCSHACRSVRPRTLTPKRIRRKKNGTDQNSLTMLRLNSLGNDADVE